MMWYMIDTTMETDLNADTTEDTHFKAMIALLHYELLKLTEQILNVILSKDLLNLI